MAKNWSAKEAIVVLAQGKDKAAIQDIGRRFPLFATAGSRGVEGLLEIIQALPDNITVRKVEGVLKEGVGEYEEEKEEKPAKAKEEKKAKKATAKKGKKKVEEPEEEEEEELEDEDWDEEDEEEEEEESLEDLTLPQLRKKAKELGIDTKKVKGKKKLIAAIEAADEDDEDEDDDDDWDI